MPNWVANRIILGGDPARVSAALADIASDETALETIEAGQARRAPLTFRRVRPRPASVDGTTSGGAVDIGLAVLSDPVAGRDYVKLKEETSPFSLDSDLLASMGFEDMVATAPATLARAGLANVPVANLEAQAEALHPGALDQARASLRAWQETGFFDWHDWSIVNWGVKWDIGEGLIVGRADGGVELQFDTANNGPLPFLRAWAERHPRVGMRGAWVDESNGLGVLFESAAGNGVIVVHSLNPFEEGIDLAEAFVRGEADDFEHRPAPRAADPDEDGPRVC